MSANFGEKKESYLRYLRYSTDIEPKIDCFVYLTLHMTYIRFYIEIFVPCKTTKNEKNFF